MAPIKTGHLWLESSFGLGLLKRGWTRKLFVLQTSQCLVHDGAADPQSPSAPQMTIRLKGATITDTKNLRLGKCGARPPPAHARAPVPASPACLPTARLRPKISTQVRLPAQLREAERRAGAQADPGDGLAG